IVFVGNIPYEGLAETQLTEIFKSVGRVVCFRMVYDRETGRSKGYGFAEYIDAETAASAVRNLDGYDVMGRKLRVDYSSQGYHAHRFGPNLTHITLASPASESAPSPSAALAAFIGSLPQGVDNHPNLSTTDSISKTLSQIPAPQLLLALGQMKDLIATDPVKAAETLRYCPQLAHALFQAMVLMNLVKPEVVSQVLEATAIPPPAAAATATTHAPDHSPAAAGILQRPRPRPQLPLPTPHEHEPLRIPRKAALLQRVKMLTQEEIARLPAEQAKQVVMLRQRLLA
ncbi:hypothetical protein P167DRAFT_470307, partial [Morchella conica CCBAS932]